MTEEYNFWKFFEDSNKVLSEYSNFTDTVTKDFSNLLKATKKFEKASVSLAETYKRLGLTGNLSSKL